MGMSWFRYLAGSETTTEKPQPKKAEGIPHEEVVSVLDSFELGSPTSFFPEFRQDLRLKTVVLAYEINRHLVYSNSHLEYDSEEEGSIRLFSAAKGWVKIPQVKTFHVIVPLTKRQEMDYRRGHDNGMMQVINDFRAGNMITLYSGRNNTLHCIETTARRSLILREGLFAGKQVVMLKPHAETILATDRRKSVRIDTSIPVEVVNPRTNTNWTTTLCDFSEKFWRINKNGVSSKNYRSGDRLQIILQLPGADEAYTLNAEVMRINNGSIVTKITGMVKNDYFFSMGDLDDVVLRSMLANHHETGHFPVCSIR